MASRAKTAAAGAFAAALLVAAGFAAHGALDGRAPVGGGGDDALEPAAAAPVRAEEPAGAREAARVAAPDGTNAPDAVGDANGRRSAGRRRDLGGDEIRRLRGAKDDAERLAIARELAASDNPVVAMEALRVLADLAPKEALALVDAWIVKSQDGQLSGWQVERALVALADGKGAAQIGAELTEALRRYYRDGDPGMQLTAARTLERRGDAGPMQQLVARLGADLGNSDVDRRAKSVDALAQTRSRSAAPLLLPLLADPSDEIRLRTLDALRRTGDASTIEKLLPLLNDPVAAVRDRATRAIESLRRGDGQGDGQGGGVPFGGRRRSG